MAAGRKLKCGRISEAGLFDNCDMLYNEVSWFLQNVEAWVSENPAKISVLPGVLFVLSGPSGVGKNSVADAVREREGDSLMESISYTTRPRRAHERDGEHYYWVDESEFKRLTEQDFFLEWAIFNGAYYGTPRRAVMHNLNQGHDMLLVIDTQGAAQVRESMPAAVGIFLLPDGTTPEEQRRFLKAQLVDRGTEAPAAAERRLRIAFEEELPKAPDYQYQVVNRHGQLSETVEAVHRIMQQERQRHRD